MLKRTPARAAASMARFIQFRTVRSETVQTGRAALAGITIGLKFFPDAGE